MDYITVSTICLKKEQVCTCTGCLGYMKFLSLIRIVICMKIQFVLSIGIICVLKYDASRWYLLYKYIRMCVCASFKSNFIPFYVFDFLFDFFVWMFLMLAIQSVCNFVWPNIHICFGVYRTKEMRRFHQKEMKNDDEGYTKNECSYCCSFFRCFFFSSFFFVSIHTILKIKITVQFYSLRISRRWYWIKKKRANTLIYDR